jgi:predicted nucleotidyltransferase component of viral defense system
MANKKTELTRAQEIEWSKKAHIGFINGLLNAVPWSEKELVFHGGTSLHLSWDSPRHSEDLDFLLSRSTDGLEAALKKAIASVQAEFLEEDPAFVVELRNKTRDASRMPVYHLVVSKPEVLGNVLVKAEFWMVEPEYLQKYKTSLRSTRKTLDGRISHPIPAATLETAFCDKLTAFATRPFLKWRDVYDLWWIGTQTKVDIDLERAVPQFLHNLSAYQTRNNLSPSDALRLFTAQDKTKVCADAEKDLKIWLPESLWKVLNPNGVIQMVDYVFETLNAVAKKTDVLQSKEEPKTMKSPPTSKKRKA